MDLWSIRIIVEDKFKELFSEYFEDFDGYLSSSLFQDKDLNSKYNKSKSYNLITNKLGEFHQNKYWLLEILLNKKPNKKIINTKLNCLAKQIAIEHAIDNVQAISLALGFVKTDLTALTKNDEKIISAKDRYLFLENSMPNPDEVADLISRISFNDLSMLNGTTLRLDGGITCQ